MGLAQHRKVDLLVVMELHHLLQAHLLLTLGAAGLVLMQTPVIQPQAEMAEMAVVVLAAQTLLLAQIPLLMAYLEPQAEVAAAVAAQEMMDQLRTMVAQAALESSS